jgi:hypothetical protein
MEDTAGIPPHLVFPWLPMVETPQTIPQSAPTNLPGALRKSGFE